MRNKSVVKFMMISICLVLILTMLGGCSENSNSNKSQSEGAVSSNSEQSSSNGKDTATKMSFTPGTYTGEAKGKEGNIKVEVTFTEDELIDIKIVSQGETAGIGDAAIDTLREQIIDSQTLAVDAVSGASETSAGLLAAVEDAVNQAGGDVETFKSNPVKKAGGGKTEQLSADVVVVGAGASGVSAAVSAADKGAKVIIVEKTATIGGASNLSWAGKFYNSSASINEGLKINVEKEIAEWIYNNHWRVDAAAIRQYVTKSGDTYDWLANKGYKTTFLNFAGEPLHVLPAYDTRQELLRNMLAESVEKNGGQVITETTAQKLITGTNGEVTGVVAEKKDGTTLEISAKSVVIATGGYAANQDMVKEAFGFEGINGGLGQNVGEGLKMAWEAGAKVPDNFGGQMLHQTLARATDKLKEKYSSFEASYPMMLSYLPNFMNVGPSGARFRDEAATLEAVAAANTSAFNGAYHMVIVSQSQIDALTSQGMNGVQAPKLPGMPPEFYADFMDQFKLDTPWKDAQQVFDTMVENGDGFKGNTIEELAANAGMDVEVFKDAFVKYQEAIKTGIDTEFGKSKEYLQSMSESGPYYAIIAEINNLGSVGGLLVNTSFQVLNDDRIPVPGLFAVGLESEGVLFNDTYVGNGVGIGYSFTSGRLGGESAADKALAK